MRFELIFQVQLYKDEVNEFRPENRRHLHQMDCRCKWRIIRQANADKSYFETIPRLQSQIFPTSRRYSRTSHRYGIRRVDRQ